MSSAFNQASDVQIPDALLPLMEGYGGDRRDAAKRRRYYVGYGGRGSGKSWGFARALLVQAMHEPLRILCVREIQRTIGDSVHRLLADQIVALGWEDAFVVQETSITGRNGAQFLFAGLRGIDAAKIKSFEGVDICWVEEAQALSKKSWDVLIPTIRAPESEIWVTFNPEMDTDDTYQRFVVHPPSGAWVRKINWMDNPWFPAVLEQERQHLQRTDPSAYEHVWEGKCKTVVEGAIYANEVRSMIEGSRVRPVPYDPMLKVHTIWDLGWNDAAAIIMAQRQGGEVRIIDYVEDSQRTLAEYVGQELQSRRYVWGDDWLPHDGNAADMKTGKSAKEILQKLGRKPRIISRMDVESGIQAARMMFPRCYIDELKGARLVDCLRRYRRGIPESTGEPGRPIHDQFSHGADAFRGLGVIVDKMGNDDRKPPPFVTPWQPAVPGVM